MAGHSKWANIQHRKGAQDKKRGKLFTKLIREITVSSRIGGGDVATNPRLRLAVDKGLGANMPKDTIERAIKRGSGDLDSDNYEEIRYEGYGPGGVAIMVDCLSDNRNRTVGEVRHAFTKHGGNLGTDGSVAYLFTKTAVFEFPAGSDEDRIMEVAIEAGAEDVVTHSDGSIEVLAGSDDFHVVSDALTAAELVSEEAHVTQRPATVVSLGLEEAEAMVKLLEVLEDLDDVQQVYSNADIDEEILAQIGA